MAKSAAQRKKEQRARLISSGRYEEFRKRETNKQNVLRRKKKEKMSVEEHETLRRNKREEMRKYREKKLEALMLHPHSHPSTSAVTPSKLLKSRSAYGKTVVKVKHDLPASLNKCRAVIRNHAANFSPRLRSPAKKQKVVKNSK